MAAEDKVGFQQFPRATFTIPSKQEMKEQIYLALNLKDGQKSVGQSPEDPYTKAVKYIEEHQIVEVFQNITARIAFEKPEDPLQFMMDEIEKVRQGQKLEELK